MADFASMDDRKNNSLAGCWVLLWNVVGQADRLADSDSIEAGKIAAWQDSRYLNEMERIIGSKRVWKN